MGIGPRSAGEFVSALRSAAALEDDCQAEIRGQDGLGDPTTVVVTRNELLGPIRARLLATGRALWRYRVALHDAAVAALADA